MRRKQPAARHQPRKAIQYAFDFGAVPGAKPRKNVPGREVISPGEEPPENAIAKKIVDAGLVFRTHGRDQATGRRNINMPTDLVKASAGKKIVNVQSELAYIIRPIAAYPIRLDRLAKILVEFKKKKVYGRISDSRIIGEIMGDEKFINLRMLKPEQVQKVRKALEWVFAWMKLRRETMARQQAYAAIGPGGRAAEREQRLQTAHLRQIMKEI